MGISEEKMLSWWIPESFEPDVPSFPIDWQWIHLNFSNPKSVPLALVGLVGNKVFESQFDFYLLLPKKEKITRSFVFFAFFYL